jgi:hypothetical protein
LIAIAEYLEGLSDPPLERRVREFMLFTNDLDVTRKQSFANSHQELLYFFEKDGFQWANERCYATDEFHRMPDGERIYKWL